MKKILLSTFTFLSLISIAQDPSNGSFETWTLGSLGQPKDPTGWNSNNVLVTSLLPGNDTAVFQNLNPTYITAGNSSAKIETVTLVSNPDPTSIPNVQGILFYGTVSITPLGFKPGKPYTTRATCLSFDYAYMPSGLDSCAGYAFLSKWNAGTSKRDTIATAYLVLGNQANMTHIDVPFNYIPSYASSGNPDSLMVYFSSSVGSYVTGQVTPQPGSIMYVDNATVSTNYCAVGINENNAKSVLKAYPNPASSYFTLTVNSDEINSVEVFDVTGKKLGAYNIEDMKVRISTDNFSNGLYIYKVCDKNKEVISTGKFNVVK
jgi:hypothetical protein